MSKAYPDVSDEEADEIIAAKAAIVETLLDTAKLLNREPGVFLITVLGMALADCIVVAATGEDLSEDLRKRTQFTLAETVHKLMHDLVRDQGEEPPRN